MKRIALLSVAVVLLLAWNAKSFSDPGSRPHEPHPQPSLVLGTTFFSNRLPEYEVRVEALLGGKTFILFRDRKYRRLPEGSDLHGLCLAEEQRIYIDSRCSALEDEFVREVLLHEMCHASVWRNTPEVPNDSHGPEFIAELRKLVALGEAWAIDQVEYYKTVPPNEQAGLPLDAWRAHRDTKAKTG